MNTFAKVRAVQAEVGGKLCRFRSKLEYRWAVWLQLQKDQGLIVDWWYEDPDSLLELETKYMGNIKKYLPDFTVLTTENNYEFHETKGYFTPKDYTKIKLAAEQYENPITLIFATRPYKAQLRRAQRLEPHLKRIIWNANKTIFTSILFEFEY